MRKWTHYFSNYVYEAFKSFRLLYGFRFAVWYNYWYLIKHVQYYMSLEHFIVFRIKKYL